MGSSFKGGVLAVALFGLFTSACSETNQPSDRKPDSDDGQTLTIYTGRDKDEVAHVVDLFTRQFPQYQGKVETVILGAQEALTRLRAEQSNPQAGFLWGGTLQGLQPVSYTHLR